MSEKKIIDRPSSDRGSRPDGQACERMDVRPLLSCGIDPLEQILARVGNLPDDAILQIDAPFDPLPLRRLMADRGYDSDPVQLSADHWQVSFRQQDGVKLPDFPDLPDFPVTRQGGILEMDLRGLAPPNPMIAVLKLIESGRAGDGFTVWLDRDPIYLHPELAERHWYGEIVENTGEGVRVRISREDDI